MNDREKNFISAVVYIFNDEKRIKKFLNMLIDILEENFEHSEIVCVNDCSEDMSVEYIKQIAAERGKNACMTLLNMSYFHGLEMAMHAGVDMAIGDFVFEFDSVSLDYDKSEVMRIYRKSLEGFDIVSASPEERGKLTSKFFYYVFDKFSSMSYKMYTERFRILSRRVINRISSMNKSVPYRKAVYANCGLKTENIVYSVKKEFKENKKIESKEKKYRCHLAIDTLILFTEVGFRISILMTVIMMLMTIFMAAYSLTTYLTSNPVEGWTTTILFLSISFFGIFTVFTIIIKYLQILVDLVFKRKRYSFESIEKLTK